MFKTIGDGKMPKFIGLSHICIMVDDITIACEYYEKLLGAKMDHWIPNWKNEGFFKSAGFIEEAKDGEVSIAFMNLPGTRLTLEIMQYHYPKGRTQPVVFSANDVSGARHVALKVTNIDEAFLHISNMPEASLINTAPEYKPTQISETQAKDVKFPNGQILMAEQTAKILSKVKYFYFIDKYGLQWEFEQGHSDIGD